MYTKWGRLGAEGTRLMEGGDISNTLTKRMLFMWEGCVAESTKRRPLESKQHHVRRTQLRPNVTKRVFDMVWRYDLRLDLFTLMGHDYLEPLIDEVDRRDLPFQHVFAYESLGEFHTALFTMPWVVMVYVSHEYSPLAFGRRTMVVPEEGDWEPL